MAARRTAIVFGANTEVGKTLCSAALIRAGLRRFGRAAYLKPLQNGRRRRPRRRRGPVERYNADGLGHCDTLHAWRASVTRRRRAAGRWTSRTTRSSPRAVSEWMRAGGALPRRRDRRRVPVAGGGKRRRAGAPAGLDVPALLVGDARLGGISCSCARGRRRAAGLRRAVHHFVGDDAALGNARRRCAP